MMLEVPAIFRCPKCNGLSNGYSFSKYFSKCPYCNNVVVEGFETIGQYYPDQEPKYPNIITLSEKEKYEYLKENPDHQYINSIRVDLASIAEDCIRKNAFPELKQDRIENLRIVFRNSRKNRGTYRDDITLEKTAYECRLLRISGSFKQAIDLSESLPMYSWNKSLLFEYLYSKKEDDFPYLEFKCDADKIAFDQLVQYAVESFAQAKDKWKVGYDEVSKPKGILGIIMNFAVLFYVLTFLLSFIAVVLYGLIAGFCCFFIGVLISILITLIPTSLNKIAVNSWRDANPEPKLFMTGTRSMPLPLSTMN
jgi:hypothetical protein